MWPVWPVCLEGYETSFDEEETNEEKETWNNYQ